MKLRDWWMRLHRGWTKFWGWLGDNFIIFAIAFLFLFLLGAWLMFRQGLVNIDEFQAYAMYAAALGTGLLAVATVFMVRKNSQLTELSRLSLEKPVIGELIVYTIEPVENRLEQDAEALEGSGIYLYDIPLSYLPPNMIPRTLYDIKTLFLGDIFGRHPHYMELIGRYPDFENYLVDYADCIKKAHLLIEQTLKDIKACLDENGFTKVVNDFPSNSKIPIKYLPFWELLHTVERVIPEPDYDRYYLWSSEVQSFWQNYKEEIMTLIHTTSIPDLITEIDIAIKACQDILAKKHKRLRKVKDDLKTRYLFTEKELESLREQYRQDTEGPRLI